ncbi:MAG: hypothetical protein GY699_08005, partial [Desulfobacteraceae bacterium]|nr:hypothetical protein [Desulfobacteraceae bacterium]
KGTIFEIYLDSAELAASEYSFINPFYNDRLHMDRVSHMPKVAELYKNEKIKFNFTDQHAKLLKSVNAGLSDYIIGINPKRPYGDATYFEPDMADILGIKYSLNSKKHAIMSKEQLEEMRELHYELLPALQVLLIYGSIKTGKYCRDTSYYSRWQKF